ncbi:MAG: S16 family serine protease [Candidatus Micrarchaeia archaeon]
MKKKFIMAVLLFALIVDAKTASMPVPAVVLLEGGELVHIEVEIREGEGIVYVATSPLVGAQTQTSARTAFKVAGKLAGVNTKNYDVLVRLHDYGTAKSVDGPSGGLAMTLLMLSILENKTLRQDLTATGTIEQDGSVGEVGEVGKKTRAAVLGGMKVILIPKNYDMFDKMVLSILDRKWNITIIEVENVQSAMQVAFSSPNTTLESNVMEVKPKERVNLTPTSVSCSNCNLEEFQKLARRIINYGRSALEEVRKQNRTEFSYFLTAIESDLEGAEEAENANFIYAGANSAFLAGINLNFLKESDITAGGLKARVKEVEECIQTAVKPKMTYENFEWVAGGEERLAWAKKKLGEVVVSNLTDDESLLFIFKELLTAESWCNASHEMFAVAYRIGGTPVNESKLKGFASGKIKEAAQKLESYGGSDFGDAGWRFEAAKTEFDNGSFVAAVFDSEYLLSAIKMVEGENASLTDQLLKQREWRGLWAALYGNHAEYLYKVSMQRGGSQSSAVLLAIYADSLDEDAVKIMELFESPEEETGVSEEVQKVEKYPTELALFLVLCLLLAIFLNVVQLVRKQR